MSSTASVASNVLDPLRSPFPSPFRSEMDCFSMESPARSLLELSMIKLSAAIRSKLDWRNKRMDKAIVDKWRTEAAITDSRLTPQAIQYVFDELSYYADLLDVDTGIELSAVDGVWQSDSLLQSQLVDELKRTIHQHWGKQSDEHKDWHPGSNRQVWDIVHPSMFCLVAGRSQVLPVDIPLDRSIAMIGSGNILTVAEYSSLLRKRFRALKVKGDRWTNSRNIASDDEDTGNAPQEAAVDAEDDEEEHSKLERRIESETAWRQGKIALQIALIFASSKKRGNQKRNITVYVKADAVLADVRGEVALRCPKRWRSWSLVRVNRWGQQRTAFNPADETVPLHELEIHSSTEGLVAAEDNQPNDLAAKRLKKEKKAQRPVSITVRTHRSVLIAIHRLDQNATIQTLMQQLSDGTGTAKNCYPAFARGTSPSKQRLYVWSDRWNASRKRLFPHRTLEYYHIRNGSKVDMTWYGDTATDMQADTDDVELLVQPLRNDALDPVFVDAQLNATVLSLKQKLSTLLPGFNPYSKLPIAHCHLFFPATSDVELTNDTVTLASLGIKGGEAMIGVRWNGDETMIASPNPQDDEIKEEDDDVLEEKYKQDGEADAEEDEDDENAVAIDDADEDMMIAEMLAEEEKLESQRDVEVRVMIDDGGNFPILTITMKPSATVRELKERLARGEVNDDNNARSISKVQGVPVERQRLLQHKGGSWPHKLMSDERTLQFYGISSSKSTFGGATCYWLKAESDEKNPEFAANINERYPNGPPSLTPNDNNDLEEQIEVSLIWPFQGRRGNSNVCERDAVNCPPNQTLLELKQRVHQGTGWPIASLRFRRSVVDPILADELTVAGVGLRDGDTLLVDKCNVDIHVTIVSPSSVTVPFTLYCDQKTTIGELKQRIAARDDAFPIEYQWVDFVGPTQAIGAGRWEALSVEDDAPLSQYGFARESSTYAHMLVCRRPVARSVQNYEEEATSDQLVRLQVVVRATNDVYTVDALAFQPLYAIKWQLAWYGVGDLDAFRLSLVCSPTENVPPRLITDVNASLHSLCITDGQRLQLDTCDVNFLIELPHGVQRHIQPFESHIGMNCFLYAFLDDTIAQLKAKLQNMTGMPADRQLFLFLDTLLTAEVSDDKSLMELGFTKTNHVADKSSRPHYDLKVYLLLEPASQPPTAIQQRRCGLVKVNARLLAASAQVHSLWLLLDETMEIVAHYLCRLLRTELKRLNPRQYWDNEVISLNAAGRVLTEETTVAAMIARVDEPLIDVFIKRNILPADDDGDESDEVDEVAGDELLDDDDRDGDEKTAVDDAKTENNTNTNASIAAASAATSQSVVRYNEPVEGGLHFPLHPQHTTYMRRPLLAAEGTTWFCISCTDDVSNGLFCYRCNFAMCKRCFDRANTTVPNVKQSEVDTTDNGRLEQSESTVNEADPSGDTNLKTDEEKEYHTSAHYAWLPTDFEVGADGSVRCLSYINNVHPIKQANMYPLIESIIARFIPLFERVLTSLRHSPQPKVPIGNWYSKEDDTRHEVEMKAREAELGDDYDEDEEYENWEQTRPIYQPDVPPFFPPSPPPIVVSLRGRRLQLILKLADIVLTPDHPRYEGGAWHVEGMRNECIVASAIAYYDQSNIGPSSLAFRCAVSEPAYEQNDDRGVTAIYGLSNEAALVQSLAAVDTYSGRAIAFPNTLQHRVAPFSLIDPTRPGYRSILVAFLVDPVISVMSTSHVPPQQREWMSDAAFVLTEALDGTPMLPQIVDSYLDWPMRRQEAEKHREKLMHERKYFVKNSNETVYERPFSLCEH